MTETATVYIVDDDPAVRDSLKWLVESLHYKVITFDNAQLFLDNVDPGCISCLVLDVRLPGMSGLQLQQQLNQEGIEIPVIIITGHGDVPMAVRALQSGAMHFLEKPFREQELLDCIQEAINLSESGNLCRQNKLAINQKIDKLTPREKQIMYDIVEGYTNKAIAEKHVISSKTVEVHRTRVMHKMEADSLPDLVKMVLLVDQNNQSSC